VVWIDLAQDKDRWKTLVDMAVTFLVLLSYLTDVQEGPVPCS
jgi:hypothetical protein